MEITINGLWVASNGVTFMFNEDLLTKVTIDKIRKRYSEYIASGFEIGAINNYNFDVITNNDWEKVILVDLSVIISQGSYCVSNSVLCEVNKVLMKVTGTDLLLGDTYQFLNNLIENIHKYN